MSTFWSLWIIVLTVVCLALVVWVLFANRKVAIRDDDTPENKTTGHVYDGIEEYDNPLPRWWFQLFLGTLIFGALYLIYYPGLGAFKGIGGWTSVKELESDQQKARATNAETFTQYLNTPIEELIHDNGAMKMGVRLFANNCAVCHGADGGGFYGFPNLTDKDWLYGGSPDRIKESITLGRAGNMPALGASLGEAKTAAVVEYVLKLSGAEHDAAMAAKGSPVFMQNCSACHGQDGKGRHVLGAPNLTDDIWLYEGTRKGITQSIYQGRANRMPPQNTLLQEEKIHILAAYVYNLSFDYE